MLLRLPVLFGIDDTKSHFLYHQYGPPLLPGLTGIELVFGSIALVTGCCVNEPGPKQSYHPDTESNTFSPRSVAERLKFIRYGTQTLKRHHH